MRHHRTSLLAASVLVALAACADSRLTAPDAVAPSQLQASLSVSATSSSSDKDKADKDKADKDKADKDKADKDKADKEKADKDKADKDKKDGESCKAGDDRSDKSKSSVSSSNDSRKSGSGKSDDEGSKGDDKGSKGDDKGSKDKCGTGGGTGGGTVTVTKALDHVMTEIMRNGSMVMINDPSYVGGAVTVPAGETRWLYYKVSYSLPAGATGVATENEASICNTMGAADVNHMGDGKIHCSINYGGATPAGSMTAGIAKWTGLTSSGYLMVPIDIGSGGLVCGDRTFTNTVTITTSTGQTATATVSTTITFICTSSPTITKTLVGVMTMDATNHMVNDNTWVPGGPVIVPGTQTRWLEYRIDYTLPNGTTGTVTENEAAVCSTMGAGVNVLGDGKITCSINYGGATPNGVMSGGVVSWGGLTGSGSVNVPIDIHNGGLACGTRKFTNTAVLTLPSGVTKTVSTVTDIKFVSGGGFICP